MSLPTITVPLLAPARAGGRSRLSGLIPLNPALLGCLTLVLLGCAGATVAAPPTRPRNHERRPKQSVLETSGSVVRDSLVVTFRAFETCESDLTRELRPGEVIPTPDQYGCQASIPDGSAAILRTPHGRELAGTTSSSDTVTFPLTGLIGERDLESQGAVLTVAGVSGPVSSDVFVVVKDRIRDLWGTRHPENAAAHVQRGQLAEAETELEAASKAGADPGELRARLATRRAQESEPPSEGLPSGQSSSLSQPTHPDDQPLPLADATLPDISANDAAAVGYSLGEILDAIPIRLGESGRVAEARLTRAGGTIDERKILPGEVTLGADIKVSTPIGRIDGLGVRLAGGQRVSWFQFSIPDPSGSHCSALIEGLRATLASWTTSRSKDRHAVRLRAERPGDVVLTATCGKALGGMLVTVFDGWTMLQIGQTGFMGDSLTAGNLIFGRISMRRAANKAAGVPVAFGWEGTYVDVTRGMTSALLEAPKLSARSAMCLRGLADLVADRRWFHEQFLLPMP
jgi:hypothetical protein